MTPLSIPTIGSVWQHMSGRRYTVLQISNMPDTPRYPMTVIYRDTVGAVWSRPVADWYRSMTLVDQ